MKLFSPRIRAAAPAAGFADRALAYVPQRPAPTTADLEAMIEQFGQTLDHMGALLRDLRAEVNASKAVRS